MIRLKLRNVKLSTRGKHLLTIEMAETDRHAEAATEKQIAFLCGRGMWCEGITKGCASWLIHMIQQGVDSRPKC